ncbi:MAG: peptide ABC transporter substrate-binding protein [Firmicutes bacterium]|nr:peptide ABC transporter substrate-binding protein [Bacillota bacterium]
MFVKRFRSALMGVGSAAILAGLLAGCGGGSTTNNTPSGNAPSGTQTQQAAHLPVSAKAGVLRFGIQTDPPQLDPQKSTDLVSFNVINAVMEGLMRVGPDGKPTYGIADKYEISSDGLTYTFHLRDAKWSDGKAITADDFKYAWTRALDPKTASDYAYQLYYIKNGQAFNEGKAKATDLGIQVKDPHTLVVTLEAPTPYFLGLMAFGTYMPAREDIVSKYGDQYFSAPDKAVYDGPFTLTEWQHNAKLVMKKNPSYWNASKVKLDEIDMPIIADTSTEVQEYLSGQLDALDQIPAENISQFQGSPDMVTTPTAATYYLALNVQDPVLKDVHIRKALAMAIDRQQLISGIIKTALPATALVPPGMPGSSPDKSFREEYGDRQYAINDNGKQVLGYFPVFDATQAKQELQKGMQDLGISNPSDVKVTLLYPNRPNAKPVSEAIQAMWQENLGISVNLQQDEWKVHLDTLSKRQQQVGYIDWYGDYNDPMTFIDMFVTNGGNNYTNWSNPQYDALVKDAKTTADTQKRMEDMGQAEKILMDEMPIIPEWYPQVPHAVRNYVKDLAWLTVGGDVDFTWASVQP